MGVRTEERNKSRRMLKVLQLITDFQSAQWVWSGLSSFFLSSGDCFISSLTVVDGPRKVKEEEQRSKVSLHNSSLWQSIFLLLLIFHCLMIVELLACDNGCGTGKDKSDGNV